MNVDACILTYTGRYVSLAIPTSPGIPTPTEFDISDIAHALSQICRFGGHTRQYYSVAQHSVLVSQIVPTEYRLQALLHDAAEAYFGDMVQPLKRQPWMWSYRDFESAMMARVFECFGVKRTADSNEAVRAADLQMLATERRDLMPPNGQPWAILKGVMPRQAIISPQMPAAAEAMFLRRFKELAGVL